MTQPCCNARLFASADGDELMLGTDAALVVLVPVFVSILVISGLRGRRSWGRTFGLSVLAVYAVGVVAVTLFPLPTSATYRALLADQGLVPRHNVVPFATWLATARAGAAVFGYQVGGNLLLLAPLGFLVPLLWSQRASLRAVAIIGGAVTLSIELTQFVIGAMLGVAYKAFDVDDLVLNLLGVVIGWALYRLLELRMTDRDGWSASRDWVRDTAS